MSGDALGPLCFPDDLQLTSEQFWAVCNANPDAVLELDASGHLIQMTPTGGETGARNQVLGALLWLAVRSSRLASSCSIAPAVFACPVAPCSAPMLRWCGWSA